MTGTRPDLSWILSKLSQFLDKPGPQHVTAIKRVFRYLKGTRRSRLTFKPSDGILSGYCNSDWAGDADDRRSTTGYVFKLGKDTAPISWKFRKQPIVALSSCEAEYMALSDAVKELLYLRSFCDQMNMSQPESSILYTDNQGAIAMTKGNTSSHTHTMHIDVRYHFLREQQHVEFQYVPTNENVADCMTKPLAKPQHVTAITRFGMV
ncbi:uncharacterized protein [Watersipora subatra]|uniref:uncharacterized protein n=1 Tax=Watersipora subatra TaxID=2589382 RepID=UPI00355BCC6E